MTVPSPTIIRQNFLRLQIVEFRQCTLRCLISFYNMSTGVGSYRTMLFRAKVKLRFHTVANNVVTHMHVSFDYPRIDVKAEVTTPRFPDMSNKDELQIASGPRD